MKKYLISIPDDIDEKITKIAMEKGITNNNEIRDTILSFYSQTSADISYSKVFAELENELCEMQGKLKKGESIEFRLADLETIKGIESVSNGLRPSAVKATIGKHFFAKVSSGADDIYKCICYKGARQRVAYYELRAN